VKPYKLCNSPYHQGPRWVIALNFNANGWIDDGAQPRWLQGWCQACQRTRARIVNGIKKRGRPYEAHQPSLRRVNPEAYRQQKRARYEAHKEEINERRREQYAQQKSRRHQDFELHIVYIEALPDRHESYHERDRYKSGTQDYADATYRDKTVDIVPFRNWLIHWHSHPDHTLATLGRAMGHVDGSRLYSIKNAKPTWTRTKGKVFEYPEGQKRITLDFVDRCLVAAGADTMLWEIYDVE